MLSMIRYLFSLLSVSQRKQFYVLQALVVLMAFSEVFGIAAITPFMALVGDMTLLQQEGLLRDVYLFSGFETPEDFLFYLGLILLSLLCLSSGITMYTTWKLSIYASKTGTQLADRLYNYYMHQSWLFHSSGSSAYFTKQISTETLRVTDGIILPLLLLNAKVILVAFISIGLFLYEPLIAINGLLILAVSYIILYKFVRRKLVSNGDQMSKAMKQRFRLMHDGFGGIKDVLLLGKQEVYTEQFKASGVNFAGARGANSAISTVPRALMELVAFGAMIGLVLILIKMHDGDLGTVLPILTMYAMAAFKLLPALQQIYSSIAQVKGNAAAFESIKRDLSESVELEGNLINKLARANEDRGSELIFDDALVLKSVSFSYPGKSKPALEQLSMKIKANSIVGIVGESGSGKSTLIDLLLGLISAEKGELIVDNNIITPGNIKQWQEVIGFVPQSIFLSEGSIAENVAFGVPNAHIDYEKLHRAINLAHLSDLVNSLPNGLDTTVGERGVQLSGGQRQRIGIARALYNQADILIFDEATSALDGITEKVVMEAIHGFNGSKTVILVAHRLKTVQECDVIFFMDKGKIIAEGTYDELLQSNNQFKKMADHA